MVSTDAYEFMQGLLADVPGLDVAATMKHIKRRFGGMDEQHVADAVEQVAQMDGLTTDNIMDRIRDKVIPIPDSVREFAKRAFPDIDEKRIRQNLSILSYYTTHNGHLDEKYRIQLRMDKLTGDIVEWAVQR